MSNDITALYNDIVKSITGKEYVYDALSTDIQNNSLTITAPYQKKPSLISRAFGAKTKPLFQLDIKKELNHPPKIVATSDRTNLEIAEGDSPQTQNTTANLIIQEAGRITGTTFSSIEIRKTAEAETPENENTPHLVAVPNDHS